MDVVIVGGDPAVQEGVLQSVRVSGLTAEGCPDLPCAREAISDGPPVALVVHESLAGAIAELERRAHAPGGAVIVFHDSSESQSRAAQLFSRSVIAELVLPLERARLVALLTHIVVRARATGRDRRGPEPPLTP